MRPAALPLLLLLPLVPFEPRRALHAHRLREYASADRVHTRLLRRKTRDGDDRNETNRGKSGSGVI